MSDKYVFFDNYEGYDFDEFKQNLIDNGIENPSDDTVYEQIRFYQQTDFEYMINEVNSILPQNLLMYGYCGTWRGKFLGGKIFENCYDFCQVLNYISKDCDYFRIGINEENNLFIKCTHHDGTNYVELKGLNDKAIKFHDEWCYEWKHNNLSEKEVHEKLWNSTYYSKKINLNKKRNVA